MSSTKVWAPDQISKSIHVFLFPQLQNAPVTSPRIGDWLSVCSLCHRCVPLSKGGGRSHVFGSSVVRNFLWFFSSLPSPARSVIIFGLKRLVDCLPGCQTHVSPNDQIRGSPPSHPFISLPCFNQHFFCSSFRHTFHQFCSNVLFQRQNTKRDGFSGWWEDSGGSGELLTEVSVAL